MRQMILKGASKWVMRVARCVFLLLPFCVSVANAQEAMYRCLIDGKTSYLDRPCPSGAGRQVMSARGPVLPVCFKPVEPLLRFMNKDNERFLSEIARICPGAKVSDGNVVAVLIDGERTEFRLSGTLPRATVDREMIYDQYQSFDFDGFNWKVLSVKRLPQIGSGANPQKPTNGIFVVVELRVKNISEKARYYGSSLLLGGGTQFPASSKSVYLKEVMGYDDNNSTKFEPGSTLKTYMVFDANFSTDFVLLIKEWMGEQRAKVRISR